jgi:hypothetical protein
MQPVKLTRSERSSLRKLLDGPCLASEIPLDHQEKLTNYRLAQKRVFLLYMTPLGKIALLRQSYGGLKPLRHSKTLLALPGHAAQRLQIGFRSSSKADRAV